MLAALAEGRLQLELRRGFVLQDFTGTVHLIDEPDYMLDVTVTVDLNRVTIRSDDNEIGSWRQTDVVVRKVGDQVQMDADGETMIIQVENESLFLDLLGVDDSVTAPEPEREEPPGDETPAEHEEARPDAVEGDEASWAAEATEPEGDTDEIAAPDVDELWGEVDEEAAGLTTAVAESVDTAELMADEEPAAEELVEPWVEPAEDEEALGEDLAEPWTEPAAEEESPGEIAAETADVEEPRGVAAEVGEEIDQAVAEYAGTDQPAFGIEGLEWGAEIGEDADGGAVGVALPGEVEEGLAPVAEAEVPAAVTSVAELTGEEEASELADEEEVSELADEEEVSELRLRDTLAAATLVAVVTVFLGAVLTWGSIRLLDTGSFPIGRMLAALAGIAALVGLYIGFTEGRRFTGATITLIAGSVVFAVMYAYARSANLGIGFMLATGGAVALIVIGALGISDYGGEPFDLDED